MNRFFSFNLLFLFVFSLSNKAQVNDAGLWLSAGLEKKINSKFSVSMSPCLRLNENISEVGSYFIDAGSEYKINKHLRTSINYRIISRKNVDDTYGLRHRFYADLSFRKKIKKLTLNYRLRLLNQYTDILSSDDGKIPDYAIRNKFQFKYDTDTKYAPFVSAEIWYRLNNRDKQFSRYRISGGVEVEINKYSSVVLSYIFQRELNASNANTDYITSVGYNYSF
ncbi:MAG: DUF2490 domain-containing protein [Bacteroidota bacterium]|jgi:hypothetical protein